MTELREPEINFQQGLTPSICQPPVEIVPKMPKTAKAIKDKIIHLYLSGRRTYTSLALEFNMKPDTVRTMVNRYRKNNSAIFGEYPKIDTNSMKKKISKLDKELLLTKEIQELKRELHLAKLKVEAYKVMGDILEEEHGIDLLKKSEANQLQFLKKRTLK